MGFKRRGEGKPLQLPDGDTASKIASKRDSNEQASAPVAAARPPRYPLDAPRQLPWSIYLDGGSLPAGLRGVHGARVEYGNEQYAIISMPAYDHDFIAKLSHAEKEVARWILMGKSDKQIAAIRACSPKTITKQINSIYEKLAVHNRAQLAQRLVPCFHLE